MPAVEGSIRLVVADDFPVMRRGVERALSRHEDLSLVGEAEDVDALMDLLASVEVDVLVLDLGMPGAVGVEPIRRIRQQHPTVRVLVYTMYEERRVGILSLKAGAHGFLHKSEPMDKLVEAVRGIAAGRRHISSDLAEQLIELAPDPRHDLPQDVLTDRELEVLRALASGLSTREVAERLGLSVKTVHTHRAHVLDKLNLRSTVDIVHYAVEHHLLGWDPEPFDEG